MCSFNNIFNVILLRTQFEIKITRLKNFASVHQQKIQRCLNRLSLPIPTTTIATAMSAPTPTPKLASVPAPALTVPQCKI